MLTFHLIFFLIHIPSFRFKFLLYKYTGPVRLSYKLELQQRNVSCLSNQYPVNGQGAEEVYFMDFFLLFAQPRWKMCCINKEKKKFCFFPLHQKGQENCSRRECQYVWTRKCGQKTHINPQKSDKWLRSSRWECSGQGQTSLNQTVFLYYVIWLWWLLAGRPAG